MPKFLLFIISIVFFQGAGAQNTDVSFQVNGLKTPNVVFGYFQGGKAYRLDSVQVDTSTGRFRLQKQGLLPGIYFCSTANEKLFDFLIPHATNSFSIMTDLVHLDSLWSPNSVENETFFQFEQQRKIVKAQFDAKKSMRTMIAQATRNDEEALKPVDEELRGLLQKTDTLAVAFVKKHPTHLYAQMLRSVRPPEPPHTLNPVLENGKPNPEYTRWQRLHYWDNTDFNNESLLGNTFWQVYFDGFFSRYVTPQTDSLLVAIDEILSKTPRNGAFYRYIVIRISQYYEQQNVPGADRIFVHMVDKYLKKNETPWLDQATLERLAYKADANRPNLTGSMAVNFTLPDENGMSVELYKIEAPVTMLVFYSPLCSHCMEVLPNIYQIYLDYQHLGLAAIAMNTDNESDYWKKFVKQQNWTWHDVNDQETMAPLEQQYGAFNLPVIYLLDKNKIILAKKVNPNDLGAALGKIFNQ